MRGMTSMRWLAVGIAAVIAGGCTCGTDPDANVCGIVVTFDSPQDGDDVGTTLDVTITATRDGGTVQIDSATLASRLTTSADFGPGRTGTINGNRVTFSGVTLEAGDNLLKASVQTPGIGDITECPGSGTITVTAANTMTGNPDVTSFTFQGDANNDKVLNLAELPNPPAIALIGTQRAVGCMVRIVDQADNNSSFGSGMIGANGVASIPLNRAMMNNLEASYNLQAIIDPCGGRTHDFAADVEAKSTLRIDRQPPTCSLDLPMKTTVGPVDDPDLATGFQLRSQASITGSLTVELRVTGTQADGGMLALTTGAQPQPMNGMVSNDFTVPATGTTSYTVSVEARDGAGNTCTAMRQVLVDYDAPTAIITSPNMAGSPYTASFVLPITANIPGGANGSIQFSIGTRQITPPIMIPASGMVSTTANFANGPDQIITAEVFDAARNRTVVDSEMFDVAVATGCSIFFTNPRTRPALIATPLYTFTVQTSCPGPVTLKQTGAADRMAPVVGGVATFMVSGLTNGTYTFTAEVGTPVASDSIQVTVDTTQPNITQPQPISGQTVAILNKAVDPNPAAGAQTTLAFSATVPMGGRVDVCGNQTPVPGGAMACPDGAAGWWVLRSGVMSPETGFTFPEGVYQLKLVVVSGGMVVATSNPVDFRVDVTPPTTSMFRLLGDANMDNRLNIAELNGMAPAVALSFNTGTGPAQVTGVTVRDQATSTTVFNNAAAVMLMSGSANVSLNMNIQASVTLYNFEAVVTDDVGNTSDPVSARLSNVTIDSVAPTCVISAPTSTLFGGPMDADPAATGYQLDEQVTTSGDTTTVAMTVSGAESLSQMVTPSGGVATHRFNLTVPAGMVSRYNFGATCSDAAGNTTAATAFNNVDIDLDPPTCTITAPVASPPQYPSFMINTTVTVAGAGTVGRSVTVFSRQGAGNPVAAGMLTVAANGTATGNISYPFSGMQTVTAEVADPAGNRCAPTSSVAIDINAMGCSLSITSPTPNGPNGETFVNSTNISIGANTSNCGAMARAVTLANITGGAPGTPIGTGGMTSIPGGDVTLTGMLPAGGPYTLRVTIDNGAGVLTTADLSNFYVDTSAPTVTSVTPNLMAPATTLFFVAPGNVNLNGAMPASNYIVDTAAGAPANFTVQANGIMNALGGRISIRFKGSEVTGQTIASNNANVTLPVSLPHNDTGNFQITISDLAGNVLTAVDASAVIDVEPPAAPSVTPTISDARAATVSLSWNATASYDDGAMASSGPHAGFDIRWTTDNVTAANGLATPADYFDSGKAFAEAIEPWSASPIVKNLKLPPFNTYYIVVRARDEVGNYSTYTAPSALANNGTKVSLVNPGMPGQNYGRLVVSNGSLNGDAIDDLVVGASAANTNKVFVYFGRTGFSGLTNCPAGSCQEIGLPGTASSDQFGVEISVGNVGDTPSPDLIVGSAFFNQGGTAPNTGRVFIFFGGANPIDTTGFIELRGTGTQTLFGRSAQVIPDIDKDGIPELAIGAPAENSGRGRIYIYRGRTRALWLAARTALDGVVPYVPTSAATWVIEGPLPVTGVNNQFALPRLGFSSLGDLNGDTFPDFTASAGSNAVNKVFLFSGNTVQSSTMPVTTGIADAGTPTPDQTLATLSIAPGASSTASFGQSVVGGLSFVNGMGNDLAIAHGLGTRIYIWPDLVTPVPPTTTMFIDGPGGTFFGNSMVAGRIDGDTTMSPTPDLIVGENPPVGAASSSAWIFYSHGGVFDTAAGQFFQSKSSGAVAATGAYGSSVAVGDFNNDMKPDVALADPSASPGSVVVWH